MSVLIVPSAKLVPEGLQGLGKLPAIIYPVDQRIVFDFLYEKFSTICKELKVVCYEAADKVQMRLHNYNNSHIVVEILDRLEDIGYTVYSALKGVEEPIFINFADTIIFDDIFNINNDSYYYAEDYCSEKWTFFEENQGEIISIEDKNHLPEGTYGKLFVGLFRINNVSYFKECLEEAFMLHERNMDSFFYALMQYSKNCPLEAIRVNDWFDIGHADTYYNSKLEVSAREFNHITIDKNRGLLRKTSENKEKFIGEIEWYLKLPRNVEYVTPRIYDYSTRYADPYIVMEYYSYHTLHELFLYGDLQYYQWMDIFKHILFVCNDFKEYSLSDPLVSESLNNMYLVKTQERFNQLRNNQLFKSFFSNSIVVNGIEYKSLDEIEKILCVEIPARLYDVKEFRIIHGDLCFANIMVDGNFSFIKLIDPRGRFGKYDIYGDFRYELAKLLHSVDGKYDFIIKDLFSVEYDLEENRITYSIHERNSDFELCSLFLEVFAGEIGEDLPKLELIEALLFLSMVPLHTESLRHQIVMLGTGLEILGRVLGIREID